MAVHFQASCQRAGPPLSFARPLFRDASSHCLGPTSLLRFSTGDSSLQPPLGLGILPLPGPHYGEGSARPFCGIPDLSQTAGPQDHVNNRSVWPPKSALDLISSGIYVTFVNTMENGPRCLCPSFLCSLQLTPTLPSCSPNKASGQITQALCSGPPPFCAPSQAPLTTLCAPALYPNLLLQTPPQTHLTLHHPLADHRRVSTTRHPPVHSVSPRLSLPPYPGSSACSPPLPPTSLSSSLLLPSLPFPFLLLLHSTVTCHRDDEECCNFANWLGTISEKISGHSPIPH